MDPSPYGPEAPNKSVTKPYKLVWRALLISNLALGAYMFAKARKKNGSTNENKEVKPFSEKEEVKSSSESISKPTEIRVVSEEPSISTVTTQPVRVIREPIPEEQQRELFKWMLEEKRKIKPKDAEEKKRIDEEKAILKQFIRAE